MKYVNYYWYKITIYLGKVVVKLCHFRISVSNIQDIWGYNVYCGYLFDDTKPGLWK